MKACNVIILLYYILKYMNNLYHQALIRTFFVIQTYFAPIIFLIIPFLIAGVTDLPPLYWICVFWLFWIIFYPKYFIWIISRRVNKLVDEGKNADLLGKHSVTVNEQGLLEERKNGENKISWSGVEKIVASNKHIFIYIGSVSACIISKRAFKTNADMEIFYEYVNKQLNEIVK